jgi:hypothetical protein
MLPKLIGVPVAFVPGLEPHDDVSVDPPLLELDAALVVPLEAALLALLLLLLLLPHPARTVNTTTTTSAKLTRMRAECAEWSDILTSPSPLLDEGMNVPRPRPGDG